MRNESNQQHHNLGKETIGEKPRKTQTDEIKLAKLNKKIINESRVLNANAGKYDFNSTGMSFKCKKNVFFCPARSFSICSIFIALIVSNRKQCLFLFRLLDFFHFPCAFLSLSFSCSLPLNSKLTIWKNQIKMPLKKIVYFRGLKVWLCVDGKDSYVWHVSCYYS